MWRAYTGVVHCVFDQISNLQNCFTTPNKNLVGEGALRLITPVAKSLYRSIFKKRRPLGFGVSSRPALPISYLGERTASGFTGSAQMPKKTLP